MFVNERFYEHNMTENVGAVILSIFQEICIFRTMKSFPKSREYIVVHCIVTIIKVYRIQWACMA